MLETTGQAFFISQVGAKDSEVRRRADEVCDFIVAPVVQEFGLDVVRADRDPTPGQVTTQIVRSLLDARLVVADLTGRNPNVYYELGVAHAFRMPVVILVDNPESLSFDTQGERVIPIGDTGVIGVSQAKEAKEVLRAALGVVLAEGYKPENLLTSVATARSLDALAPTNPMAAELAAIRETVEAIQALLKPKHSYPAPRLRRVELEAALDALEWGAEAELVARRSPPAPSDAARAALREVLRTSTSRPASTSDDEPS